MMKPKILLTMLSLFFATAFAESPSDTANFNVLHGAAYYNAVLTPSEAPSVHRNIYTPYLMYGSNLVALGPSNAYGIASYTSNNQTSFLAYLNNMAMLGIATKSFGFSIAFDIDEKLNFFKEKDAYHKEETTEIHGRANNLTLRLAFPMQSIDFLATLRYYQSNDSLAMVDYADSEGKIDYDYHRLAHDIYGVITFTNRPSAKNFSWRTGGSLGREFWWKDSTLKSTIDPDDNYKHTSERDDSYFYASLFYNFGYIVLKSGNARVHVGNNATLNAYIFDRVEDKDNHRKDAYMRGTLTLTPHLLAEYVLNENWVIWASADYSWSSNAYREEYIELYKTEDETKNYFTRFSTKSGRVYTTTGVLFRYKHLTLETSIMSGFYNNPFRGFTGNTILFDFSGIVTF